MAEKLRVGDNELGKLYTDGKVRKRREWRGVSDTLYDYWRWLGTMSVLAKFIVKPRNIKAMFRYRWMANYLASPMMLDLFSQGLRGEHLRIMHEEYDTVFKDIGLLLDKVFRGDKRIGNDKKFSDKVVLVDENAAFVNSIRIIFNDITAPVVHRIVNDNNLKCKIPGSLS